MNRTKLPRRMVVAPVTTKRRIMDTRRRVAVTGVHDLTHHTDQGHMARCELDSHADTCVLGSNFKLIELTGEVVDVVPYHKEYDAKKDVPIVSAAMAWTHPDTGETFILDYHQALWPRVFQKRCKLTRTPELLTGGMPSRRRWIKSWLHLTWKKS